MELWCSEVMAAPFCALDVDPGARRRVATRGIRESPLSARGFAVREDEWLSAPNEVSCQHLDDGHCRRAKTRTILLWEAQSRSLRRGRALFWGGHGGPFTLGLLRGLYKIALAYLAMKR